jgi:PilZ domain-containing protein
MQTVFPREAALNTFRRYPRVRALTPFSCSLTPLNGPSWFQKSRCGIGVVYDLSVQGLRLSTEVSIEPGDQVSVTLRLPNQVAPAEIAVATVRWTKDQIYGLAFRTLSDSARRRLTKYMAVTTKVQSPSGV